MRRGHRQLLNLAGTFFTPSPHGCPSPCEIFTTFRKLLTQRHHQTTSNPERAKESRAIATRFEKLGNRFLDLVKLAAICDWLKRLKK